MASHVLPGRRFGRRLPRWAVVALAVVALLSVAGSALALYLSRAHVSGSAVTGSFTAQFQTMAANSNNAAGCPTVAVSSGSMTLTPPSGSALFPGDSCDYTGQVGLASGASSSGYVDSVEVASPTTLPAGWKVLLVSGCGSNVATSTPAGIGFGLRLDANLAAADGRTVDLSGVSVRVGAGSKPSGWTSAGCTVTGA